jgi:hypothetical protein
MGVPLPFSATGALASVTDVGLTVVASNTVELKTATGTVPPEPRLMLLGWLPGLMSMGTINGPSLARKASKENYIIE